MREWAWVPFKTAKSRAKDPRPPIYTGIGRHLVSWQILGRGHESPDVGPAGGAPSWPNAMSMLTENPCSTGSLSLSAWHRNAPPRSGSSRGSPRARRLSACPLPARSGGEPGRLTVTRGLAQVPLGCSPADHGTALRPDFYQTSARRSAVDAAAVACPDGGTTGRPVFADWLVGGMD